MYKFYFNSSLRKLQICLESSLRKLQIIANQCAKLKLQPNYVHCHIQECINFILTAA